MFTQQHFTFVNVSAPQESKSDGNKKRIRSAAAASGWAQGSRPKLPPKLSVVPNTPRSSHLLDVDPCPTLSELPNQVHDIADPETHQSQRGSHADSQSIEHTDANTNKSNIKRKRTSQTSSSRRRAPQSLSTASASSHSAVASPTVAVTSWVASIQTPDAGVITPSSSSVTPHDLGSGVHDAFNCYPINTQAWHDRVLHHSKR
jgi:hypothetical protein